ncbi:hypothetical protein AK812_SmicGene4138 [Symbiodinium microadriaticum]|uniref:Uncharacterized protein n=1 Tax=Symbiodinium microadriaticum TaxID=2951 RepID=A0A1Q9EX79_SYMMI|nr:hypothetical protein AK812_SmicGene4138 [Symbiodinium microadriaticum]
MALDASEWTLGHTAGKMKPGCQKSIVQSWYRHRRLDRAVLQRSSSQALPLAPFAWLSVLITGTSSGASKGNPVQRSRLEHLAYRKPSVSFQTRWTQLLKAATVLQSEACAGCLES